MEINIPNPTDRTQYMDFLGFVEADSTVKWLAVGTGVETFDYSPGAQTLTTRFVNEKSETTITTGYKSTIAFSGLHDSDSEIITRIMQMAYKRKTGKDVLVYHRRVFTMWAGTAADTYQAFEEIMSVALDSNSADSGTNKVAGTLSYMGGFAWGDYNPTTDKFTEVAA